MAANVGDLAVRVGGDVSDLETGMAKGARAVKNFSSQATKQLRNVTNQAAKMGAAAVAAGAAMTAAIYVKQTKVIDSLAKTADALNVTTESLQAMNHLAELNGVSSESMAKGLRRMEVNLGMAARQGGNAAKALGDVGVNVQDIIKLRPDEQLQVLSGAISNVQNQSIKASIATDLFGRDGVAMLKVLNQVQKDGIAPTIQMLNDYGIAISRLDAAQVEAANDAFLEAQKIIEGLGNTLTIELAPYVTEIADRFKAAAKESGGFGDEVSAGIGVAIRAAGKFADVIHGLKVVFKGVELVANSFGAAVVTVFEIQMNAYAKFADGAIAKINKVIEGVNKIPKVSVALIDNISDSGFMQGINALGDQAREKVAALRGEMHNLAMQELPSQAVEDFLNAVKEKSIETAQVVADAREKIINPSAANDDDMTPEEKYASDEQRLRDHLSVMYGIRADSNKGIEGLMNKHWGLASSATAGAMKSVLNTMSTGSRKAFEISRAWAISDAIVSTAQGIAAGVRLGWPMAIPAVAYAAATGLAQIQQIKSQKFGGGGGSSSAPAAVSTPAPQAGGQAGGGQGGAPSSTLTVAPIDPNAIFSGSAMQAFGEQIYDYTRDGGNVVFAA